MDLIIIGVYLFATLYIGISAGRSIKSFKDFAISDRRYSNFVIIATISATLIGGGTSFGLAEKVFSAGLVYVAVISGAALNQIWVSYIIAPRIGRFQGMLSVGDMMHELYGKPGRLVGGLATALISLGFVGTQVSAIGYIFNYFLGIPQLWGILGGCGIVVLYSSFGGMRSVIATDILQFAILIIAIPLVCTEGLQVVKGYERLFEAVPSTHLFPSNLTFDEITNYVFLFLTFLSVGAFYPSFIQRLLASKDLKQAVLASRINGLISIPFYIIVGLIGLEAVALAPDINPNLALPYLVNTILPIGLKGIVITGLLAIIMSSADSELNVAGIAVVHDIIHPLAKQGLTDAQELRITRWGTFVLGGATIGIALSFESIIDIMLYAFNFWAPTVFVPLVAGILGIRISQKIFVISVFCSVGSVLFWNFHIEPILGVGGLIPSMLLSACLFFGYGSLKPLRFKSYEPIEI